MRGPYAPQKGGPSRSRPLLASATPSKNPALPWRAARRLRRSAGARAVLQILHTVSAVCKYVYWAYTLKVKIETEMTFKKVSISM